MARIAVNDRAAIVTATFDALCLYNYQSWSCPDLILGKLTEVPPVPSLGG